MAEDYVWLGPGRLGDRDYQEGDPVDISGVENSFLLTEYNQVAHKETEAAKTAIRNKEARDQRASTTGEVGNAGSPDEPAPPPDGGPGDTVNLPFAPGGDAAPSAANAMGSNSAGLTLEDLGLADYDEDPNIGPLPTPPMEMVATGEMTAPTVMDEEGEDLSVRGQPTEPQGDPRDPPTAEQSAQEAASSDDGDQGDQEVQGDQEGASEADSDRSGEASDLFASDAACELAEKEEVDPSQVQATGANGITKKDVEDYLKDQRESDES